MVYLDVACLVESVHLVEKLKQDSLNLTVRTSLSIETLRRNGIDFVNEDDCWRVLSGEPENVSNHTGTFTKVLLDEFRSIHADEGGRRMMGDSFDKHSLASTCWRY
jgi:hypothetical protein